MKLFNSTSLFENNPSAYYSNYYNNESNNKETIEKYGSDHFCVKCDIEVKDREEDG